jgi:hypothetical protein
VTCQPVLLEREGSAHLGEAEDRRIVGRVPAVVVPRRGIELLFVCWEVVQEGLLFRYPATTSFPPRTLLEKLKVTP